MSKYFKCKHYLERACFYVVFRSSIRPIPAFGLIIKLTLYSIPRVSVPRHLSFHQLRARRHRTTIHGKKLVPRTLHIQFQEGYLVLGISCVFLQMPKAVGAVS